MAISGMVGHASLAILGGVLREVVAHFAFLNDEADGVLLRVFVGESNFVKYIHSGECQPQR